MPGHKKSLLLPHHAGPPRSMHVTAYVDQFWIKGLDVCLSSALGIPVEAAGDLKQIAA